MWRYFIKGVITQWINNHDSAFQTFCFERSKKTCDSENVNLFL